VQKHCILADLSLFFWRMIVDTSCSLGIDWCPLCQQHVDALEVLLQGLCGSHRETVKVHEICLKTGQNLGKFPCSNLLSAVHVIVWTEYSNQFFDIHRLQVLLAFDTWEVVVSMFLCGLWSQCSLSGTVPSEVHPLMFVKPTRTCLVSVFFWHIQAASGIDVC
jgi:hypothetical protein